MIIKHIKGKELSFTPETLKDEILLEKLEDKSEEFFIDLLKYIEQNDI